MTHDPGRWHTDEYTFKIDNYTPETLPFERLVEYYVELKKMLGADGVHLLEIRESSHASHFKVDRNDQSRIEKRLIEIKQGNATRPVMNAFEAINQKLQEDKASALLLNKQGAEIIPFPGGQSVDQAAYRIRDAATFTGDLYHIAGSKDDVKVRISTESYGVVFCSTSKEIAKELRDFLFESVKVSGRGTWFRTPSGDWKIDNFIIADYAPVRKEGLRKAINSLRSLNIDWPSDPLGEIRRLNEETG